MISQDFLHVVRHEELCTNCLFCELSIACPSSQACTGCGTCVTACPNEARHLIPDPCARKTINLEVDGESHEVPERITLLRALELLGFTLSKFPDESDLFVPCQTGGCWSCAVLVDGKLKPTCITPVRDGMRVQTSGSGKQQSLRIVSGFQGHSVGGVGTPWQVKQKGLWGYIEVAIFASGCVLRCPSCQNWRVTYSSVESPLTPYEAAREITKIRKSCKVDRMAISGGESTLNRRWLSRYLVELKQLNPDNKARFHVDTNACILTPDYLDELVASGLTDIGPDLKGLELDTFMRITGLRDRVLARKYHNTAWSTVKYLLDNYKDNVFIGVGIPYNKKLIDLEEIERIGDRLASWDPEIQVCVLDYRPEFRAKRLLRPSFKEMQHIKTLLNRTGLTTVICQTNRGHIGP